MSQDLYNVTYNASTKESNPDVIKSNSMLMDGASIDVTSNVVTSTQTTIIRDTDSVFDRSEPSITFFNKIPRKRAKSLSYEIIGTRQKIPPLHCESKNASCLYIEVTHASTSVDICA